jgi:hypothetical protein
MPIVNENSLNLRARFRDKIADAGTILLYQNASGHPGSRNGRRVFKMGVLVIRGALFKRMAYWSESLAKHYKLVVHLLVKLLTKYVNLKLIYLLHSHQYPLCMG